MLLVGLWPYQRSKLTELQSGLFMSIIMSYIIFMVRIYLIIIIQHRNTHTFLVQSVSFFIFKIFAVNTIIISLYY